jgi:hypothetical protein
MLLKCREYCQDRIKLFTTGKHLDFYWWRMLKALPAAAEVYPLWYRSIDLSTDPGLKSHLITRSYSE